MLFSLFGSGFDKNAIVTLLLSLPVILISLTVHEVSHGFIAYKCGDPMAKNLGRLSLNPLKHLDPMGALSMLLVGFGWAKPVPINPRNFKKPRRDIALVSLAGPVSNLLLALVSTLLYTLLLKTFFVYSELAEVVSLGSFLDTFLKDGSKILLYSHSWLFQNYFSNLQIVVLTVLQLMVMLNVGLALFNLIPIPPLDGSKILASLLPQNLAVKYLRIEQYTSLIFLVIILLGNFGGPLSVFSDILFVPLEFLRELIMSLYMKIFWFIL